MSINAQFNSLDYWRARHEKYLHDPRGVGNVTFSKEENERIYEAMDAYVWALASSLNRSKPTRVLDLGCGIGMIAGAFIRAGCQYTGVDISEKAIEIARQRHPSGTFEVGNIAKLPLKGPFDIIIERTVFIHLVEDEYWRSVIGEVKRLLAGEGTFILMDHMPATPEDAPKGAIHVKFRLLSEYASMFESVGLKFNSELRDRLATKMQLSPYTYLVAHK